MLLSLQIFLLSLPEALGFVWFRPRGRMQTILLVASSRCRTLEWRLKARGCQEPQRGRADSWGPPKDEDHQSGSQGSMGSSVLPNDGPGCVLPGLWEGSEERMKSFLGLNKCLAGLMMSPWHAKVSKCHSTLPGSCEPARSLTSSEEFSSTHNINMI